MTRQFAFIPGLQKSFAVFKQWLWWRVWYSDHPVELRSCHREKIPWCEHQVYAQQKLFNCCGTRSSRSRGTCEYWTLLGEEAMNGGLWLLLALQQKIHAPKRSTYTLLGKVALCAITITWWQQVFMRTWAKNNAVHFPYPDSIFGHLILPLYASSPATGNEWEDGTWNAKQIWSSYSF